MWLTGMSCSACAAQPVPLPPPDSGQIETRQFVEPPGRIGMIPTRRVGLCMRMNSNFIMNRLSSSEVLHLAMPDVVMDQQEPTRFQAARHFRHQRLIRTLRLVLAAGDHAGGATLERRGLRHVHDHRPAAAVVAHAPQIAPVAVLVDALRVGARQVVVQRAVRVHHVIWADHAGQRAAHDGVSEDLVQLRHRR